MKGRAVLLLLFLMASALRSPAEAPHIIRVNVPVPPDVQLIPNVEVGKAGGKTLYADLAVPKNRPPTPIPAILIVHGGGWSGGNRKESFTLAYFLASHGYFLASIEYRLSGEAKWPAQIEDCKLAVRWLRANAAKYNIDPERIGCWGHSAGAHLAACLGTMDDPALDVGAYPGVSSRVQAVADFDGPSDLPDYAPGLVNDSVTPKQSALNIKSIVKLLGAGYARKPARWKNASPINFVKPGDPPFLVVHGAIDQMVPLSQGLDFAAALKKAGVPTELIVVQNGNHGLFNPPGQPASSPDGDQLRAATAAFFDTTLNYHPTP